MLTESLHVKLNTLRRMISDLQSVLVALSGGIDSTVVLKIAHEQLGDHALAVTAVSPTFPQVELDAAKPVASEIGARHELVHTDQLEVPAFVQNDATRCFHCKTDLYQLLDGLRAAARRAFSQGLEVHGGHGIDYATVRPIAAIPEVVELNIGHFLIGEAIFVGLEEAVSEMRRLMDLGRAGA